ncbi:ABC transporter permease [Cryptosporangium aurantiacum]|uniref:Autoinducer 2 import system permease protein LsrD n=1 Tax=Cryptosporangium aurantiacum TaxID=134849 RepID=A0A1M7R8J5_9ACTN|nr:ABC transporter permease [Cryptosporangium aurantiacum]SHN42655.1 monosaccharide ABC transporter membrane protein, CUT2 family [Cryptosporangium aurantiacum]
MSTTVLPPKETSEPRPSAFAEHSPLRRLLSWEGAITALLIFAVLAASFGVEGFADSFNLTNAQLDIVEIAILSLTLTLLVVIGEIDLSIASNLGMCSALMGVLWNAGLSIETIIPITILVGAVAGALNGFLVTVLGLPSLAVTIGTLALYRGLAYVLLGDKAVADFPVDYTSWTSKTIGSLPIPNPTVLVIILAIIVGILLHATPIGRSLYAIGSNKEAARFAGIRVKRITFWLFVASGAFAGLAAIIYTFRFSSARADNANGLELTVVAAVLLGGVSIFGGRGTLPGVIVAVLLVGVIRNALILDDVAPDTLMLVTGGLLIISVLAPNAVTWGRERWRLRKLAQKAASTS